MSPSTLTTLFDRPEQPIALGVGTLHQTSRDHPPVRPPLPIRALTALSSCAQNSFVALTTMTLASSTLGFAPTAPVSAPVTGHVIHHYVHGNPAPPNI